MKNAKRSLVAVLALALFVGVVVTPAQAGLISHWKLDELTGNAADSVGSNTGTVGAGITQGATGKINTAYDFPGTSGNTVNVAHDASLNPTSLTVSAWVKTTQTGNCTGIVQKYASANGYLLDFTAGLPRFMIRAGFSNSTSIVGTSTVNDGVWHMLTGTFDSTTGAVKLYIDGILENSATGGVLASTTASLLIGHSLVSTNMLVGSIDDVQLYDSEASDTEVLGLYNNPGSFIPEPASSSILLLGAIALLRRRRNQGS